MNDFPVRSLTVTPKASYVSRFVSGLALLAISAYQVCLSPIALSLWGPACRFEPTCSAYAAEAISRYGIIQGGLLALKRLLQCRPLGGRGFDPVPQLDA
jgi:putative membrane protein insertion efficiency factor